MLQRKQSLPLGHMMTSFVLMAATTLACDAAESPRVLLLDGQQLAATRRLVFTGDARFADAMEKLREDAAQALQEGPFSVTHKTAVPPSGDKRDYMSLGPYWWPNPDTTDGLPYVHRDGERNPEIDQYPDSRFLGKMTGAVETLATAYFFTGDERCADHATLLLRTWFLNDKTRMNPHLEFGQAIRGINTGRGIGIIQTRALVKIIDAVGLLESSQAWTRQDHANLKLWCKEYLDWLLDSHHGKDEARAKNNHGTYYDMQVAALALFVGEQDLATKVLQDVGPKRIASQIEPDGRQLLELARTKSWSYSIGNLIGLMSLAAMADHQGIDLWNYESPEGASLRRAIDFLKPVGLGQQEWSYQQIGEWSTSSFHPILRCAADEYADGPYHSLLKEIPRVHASHRSNLLGWRLGSF